MQDCQKGPYDGSISRRLPLTIFHFRNGPQVLDGLHGGSSIDMTDRIAQQVERFGPGWRNCILASVICPIDFDYHNANLVGEDINGGSQDPSQMFVQPPIGLHSIPCTGL